MNTPFILMRYLGKAVLNAVGGGVLGEVLVDVLPDIARDVWDRWSKEKNDRQRRAELESIAQAATDQVREEVAKVVEEIAADRPPEDRARLRDYLTQLPAAIHRTLRRPEDPGGATVPAARALQKADDLLAFLPEKLPRFKPGDRPLAGVDWELVELLGVGGYGEVWKARHPDFDGIAPVALKFCLDPAAKDRLLRHEAAVLNQVMRQGRHDGIVALRHAYLRAEPPCLEYEYVSGGDLAGWLARHEDGLGPDLAASVMRQLAKVMGFAHRLDPPIVHRDLKPANILVQPVTASGAVLRFKIADFGIGGLAAYQALRQTRQGITQGCFLTNAVRGSHTPLYASPQQMRGEPPDPRDDVHALGVIWHQLLTGDLSAGAPSGRRWAQRLLEKGMREAEIDLLAACVEPVAADRLENAAALAERLDALRPTEAAPQDKNRSSVAPPEPPRTEPAVLRTEPPPVKPAVPVAIGNDLEYPLELSAAEARDGFLREIVLTRELCGAPPETLKLEIPPGQRDGQKFRIAGKGVAGPRGRGDLFVVLRIAPARTDESAQTPTLDLGGGVKMELVRIESGEFMMGSPRSEKKQIDDDTLHRVRISRPYYLGKCAVTQQQWRAVMGNNPSYFEGDDLPVEQVSWGDCQAFCRKLSEKTGRTARLPTEAEWEYACRAGMTTPFHFGETISPAQANYNGNFPYNNGPQGEYRGRTTPASWIFPANAWGLHNMHGNVFEWCQDWYGPYGRDLAKTLIDPAGPEAGVHRVMRGGSWSGNAANCRAAYRGYNEPANRDGSVGFRVAVEVV